MEKNVQALFQLQDSFVKEFNINVLKKIESKEGLEIGGQLGFRVINLEENKKDYLGQIELINELKISKNKEELATIHICMAGLFTGTKNEKFNKDDFEEMLKINGASTLSHLMRAYIYTMTGLSGMPQITTPMINFVEFFNSAQEGKSKSE